MNVSVLFGYLHDDGPRDVLFSHVLRWWITNFPGYEICVGRNFDAPFHRGKARDSAYDESTGDVLIIADADTIPTRDAVDQAVKDVGDNWIIPYGENRYYNLTEQRTAKVIEDRMDPIPEPQEEDWDHRVTAWAGCLVLPREAWITVDGYDERFIGWGGEDNAFQLCVDSLWSPHVRLDSYVCHLWHPRGDADFSQPFWPANRRLLRQYQMARNVEQMRNVRFG